MDLKINTKTSKTTFRKINSLSKIDIGESIIIRARVYAIYSDLTNVNLILSQDQYLVHCYEPLEEYKSTLKDWMELLEKGSIVELIGLVELDKQCTNEKLIMSIQDVVVVSMSARSPININYDLLFREPREIQEKEMTNRLDNRILDLRTKDNKLIFSLQSFIGKIIRNFLDDNNFMEIHTPKLISSPIDCSTEMFSINYFDKPAFLTNSTQIHKQMMICADYQKIYEIGPIFCANKEETKYNLSESTSIDIEMTINESFMEIVDFMEDMFIYLFDNIHVKYGAEILALSSKHNSGIFQYSKMCTKITYKNAIGLLMENGIQVKNCEEFSSDTIKHLSSIIRKEYDTDFFIVYQFPKCIRPFYTFPSEDSMGFSNSYDIFIRGNKISSGCESISDFDSLISYAKLHQIDVHNLSYYFDSFKYGTPKHGGGSIGLEKLVMSYLGIENIRNVSLFPRDQSRLTP